MKLLFLFLLLPFAGRSQSQALKYQWKKISGPPQYKIVSPNSPVTDVTNLEEGVYKFELTVTNRAGLSARDTMVLTVNAPKNSDTSKAVKTKLGTPAHR